MDREAAVGFLRRFHAVQGGFYAGDSEDQVKDLLTEDVTWYVPGQNAIAGNYRGREAVLDYFGRRRDLADRSFRMHPQEVMVGDGDHVASLTDGTATIAGEEHRWSTIGLYRLRSGRLAACWLLPLDQRAFDAIWADRDPGQARSRSDDRSSSDRGAPACLDVTDAGEILTLQRAAYVTEAQLHDDVQLPPLTQTLEELRAELARPSVLAWGYRDSSRLIAAVRVELNGNIAALGRTAVAPDRQGSGLGASLVTNVERLLPSSVDAVELFTGEHSERNLRLWRRLGYCETYRSSAGAYQLVHLRKTRRATS